MSELLLDYNILLFVLISSIFTYCRMERINFKSFGSRRSLNLYIFWKKDLSLFFRIIYLILNVTFQVYHVSITNINASVIFIKIWFNIFISLRNYHYSLNAFVKFEIYFLKFFLIYFECPLRVTCFRIDLVRLFIKWIFMRIITNWSF